MKTNRPEEICGKGNSCNEGEECAWVKDWAGGQQSPMPELKEPWTPSEWERPDDLRMVRGEEEERRGVMSMSNMATAQVYETEKYETKG